MNNNEKIELIKEMIKGVMCSNFCEDDTETYMNYLEKDLNELEDYKISDTIIDYCTIGHLTEEIWLLQDIIKIIMQGDEDNGNDLGTN